MSILPPMLAQAEESGSILLWSLVLVGSLLVLFAAVAWYRKWLRKDEFAGGAGGFTLSDLRQLHKSGQMSTEEYEKAKAALVDSATASPTRTSTAATPA